MPLSSQKFLVLIRLILEGWKTELTLKSHSVFEPGIPGLGNQYLTRRRKASANNLGWKKRKSDVFYSLQKKKMCEALYLTFNLFINKIFHTFLWSFQLKNLMYVMLDLFCSTRSCQSRQVRSVIWKSFNKNKYCLQYLPLYLCNFYLTVCKLLYAKKEIQQGLC